MELSLLKAALVDLINARFTSQFRLENRVFVELVSCCVKMRKKDSWLSIPNASEYSSRKIAAF